MEILRELSDPNDSISLDSKRYIQRLLSEVKRYQDKTKSYIDSNYVDFLPNLASNEMFLEEGDKLIQEVDDLLQTTTGDTKTDLYTATEELRQYVEELQEISVGLTAAYKVLQIDDIFQSLEEAKSSNEYLIVMELVGRLKTLIYDSSDKILPRLECYANIKIRYHIETEMLLHNLNKGFEKLVQFTEKQFQNTKAVNLKISKDKNQLEDTTVALFQVRFNPKKMCDFLLTNCFEPIIMKPVSMELREDDSSEFVQLSLSYSLKDLGDNLRPNYKVVFKNIQTLIECLAHMNSQISEKICVFSIFGEHMKERLMHLLIHECLIFSIPETMDEMDESTLVEDIDTFYKYLVDTEFLDETIDLELPNYAEKIGLLFRNRFCTNIFDKATDIMRKDLHDMSLIAENNTSDAVSNNPFLFPRCMVSKSTLELINLMEKVLRQAQTADKETADHLIGTIPIILNKYLSEVPSHHEKLLFNIPQQTALFHNNCMFLAHWVTKNSESGIESFQIIMKTLQSLGSDHFLAQISNQRKQLKDIINEFDLSGSVSELGLAHKKVIRQCVRQLDLLKNVWQTILPDVVYNKTMTNLLNDLCSELIRRISSMEDIASSVANELVDIIGIIEERSPTIFQDPHYVLNVKNWTKMTQLKMILGSSLIQITEQWSEGKGPLTLNYKVEEVKHFIRALFQNTDRRANALALIV